MKKAMIKSMTGYGRAQANLSGYDITVELKSVNHRYFEFSARIPRAYGYLEEKLKNFVYSQVFRGKIDCYASITPVDSTDTVVQINRALARSYLEELRALGEELELKDDLALARIAGFSDIFMLNRANDTQELIWSLVQQITTQALQPFLEMRTNEGQKLKEDVLLRLDLLENLKNQIAERSPQITAVWRQKLQDKITEVLGNYQLDESRILTEAAIYAERIATDEETVRLQSHIDQFRSILEEPESVGRKLDFLVQEVNREINTIGSKSQDIETSKLVVEMKSETEKIREQIQNIE